MFQFSLQFGNTVGAENFFPQLEVSAFGELGNISLISEDFLLLDL